MQKTNQAPNSNTKSETSDTVTPRQSDNSNITLDKIVATGRLLSDEEKQKLFDLLKKNSSAATKALLKAKLTIPVTQWRNRGLFARVLFQDDGVVRFIAAQSHPEEIAECRNELLDIS